MEGSEIIKLFCEKTGIGFEPDADGTVNIEVDGAVVTISDLREIDAIALVGDLGEPPPERLEALYKVMLEANHLFGGTCGATISRDPKTGRFALCRVMPCAVADGDFFYAEVERFASTLETWGKIVRDFRDAPPGDDSPKGMSGDGAQGLIAV